MDRGEKKSVWLDTVFIDTVKTYYTKSNAIRSRSFYQDGYQEGSYNFYHENGRIKEKGIYKKNGKIGYVIRWTDLGNVNQVLQYFYNEKMGREDSFKIINYWDDSNVQVVKDGTGFCKCHFDNGPIEEGNVRGGYRDSIWRITFGDTLVSEEVYENGRFVKGESTYMERKFQYTEKFQQAEFKNGIRGMMTFLNQNIKYPDKAKRKGDQGKVFVRFFISAEGEVSDLKVLKGVTEELNEEAMRVIRNSNKKWIPGKTRGVPTKSQFVLPVYFKLDS